MSNEAITIDSDVLASMTIKELLNLPGGPSDLEKMTDAELWEHCKDYLRVVELKEEPSEPKATKSSIRTKGGDSQKDWIEEAKKLMARHGLANIELPKDIKL